MGAKAGESGVPRLLGRVLLGLSAMGFPMTQFTIRRFGLSGAAVCEAVCGGLLIRDAAMLARGAPGRLRRVPAVLLWLETIVAAVAALTGFRLLVDPTARHRAGQRRPDRFEYLRRAAVGTLFGLHTVRFRIYLRPDQGRSNSDDPRPTSQ